MADDRVPVAPSAAVVAPEPMPVPTEPPGRSLDRAAVLALASMAADAAAQGSAPSAELSEAVGKRFSIALPFGCNGPAGDSSNAPMRWQYDDEAEALRFHIAPVELALTEWWPDAPSLEIEAIEGFWIARPWTGSESCRSAGQTDMTNEAGTTSKTEETLAIVQIFASGGARQNQRKGRPYTAVVRTARDGVRADEGFRLRLTGNIAAVPGGGAAVCRQASGPDRRPICLIATTLDTVTIEDAASGDTLVTWAEGSARQTE